MFNQDQEIFNILLHTILEGVIIVDRHQKIMEVNNPAETIFGYTKKELIGKNLNLLLPSNHHVTHKCHFNDFVKQGESRIMGDTTAIFGLKKNGNMLLKEGQQINYPENIDDYLLYQDEKIIELTFTNLLNNAIKYSPENSIIDLSIKQDNTNTTFKVKDLEIGIPEKDKKSIFKRYFRAKNVINTQAQASA